MPIGLRALCPFNQLKECSPRCALYDPDCGMCFINLVLYEYHRLLKDMRGMPEEDKPNEH